MNPHLDQLRLALVYCEAEIDRTNLDIQARIKASHCRSDKLSSHETQKLAPLPEQRSELLKQIAEEALVKKPPCVIR